MMLTRSLLAVLLMMAVFSSRCEREKTAIEPLVLAFENGKESWCTEDEALARGLTLIDFSDNWAPFLFSQQGSDNQVKLTNRARQLYTNLANGESLISPTMSEAGRQLGRRSNTDAPPTGDAFVEVYGISPSISLIKNRAESIVLATCFDKVIFDRIRQFSGVIEYENTKVATSKSQTGLHDSKRLREDMTRLKTTDPKQVSGNWKNATTYDALVEIQNQLVCEGLLNAGSYITGGLDRDTHQALAAFERKSGIMGFGQVGGRTLKALQNSPTERLHLTFVRALTERVVDAAGVIEDKLSKELTDTVLAEMDLLAPEKTIKFLENTGKEILRDLRIAVHLPSLPRHYKDSMKLTVEIDRGDVWYDYPVSHDGHPIPQPRQNKPTLTLFTNWNNQKIPLVTMPTTIGGWQNEMSVDGKQSLQYKNSKPGPGAWNKIVAGPIWIPPDTTPPKELIKKVRYGGKYVNVVDYNQIGPWYGSAYGLAAAFHVSPANTDTGIRTHGTHDYNAIYNRYSHGCHRLPNHLAIRLFSFVLKHSPHKRIGHIEDRATVSIEHEGNTYPIKVNDRGYTFELRRPIPVRILKGRILGKSKTPILTKFDARN